MTHFAPLIYSFIHSFLVLGSKFQTAIFHVERDQTKGKYCKKEKFKQSKKILIE